MVRLLASVVAFAALTPFAWCGIVFTSPSAGAQLVAGKSISVEWEDGGEGPNTADLMTYELFLCAGGNSAGQNEVLHTITTSGSFADGNTASGVVDTAVGGNSLNNAYFLKMIAVGKSGAHYTTYSNRFSFSDMTGAFPESIQPYLSSISGTDGPASEDNTIKARQAGAGFGVAYTLQTGLTRYAPMQPVPPTKITATNTAPLFPTSSVVTATTLLPIPSIQTTVTQPQTFSVSSRQNTAAPAPQPSNDMQKFLNRWKD